MTARGPSPQKVERSEPSVTKTITENLEARETHVEDRVFEHRNVQEVLEEINGAVEDIEGDIVTIDAEIAELEAAISHENLWDRSGTTLEPHNAGDGIEVGDITLGAGATVNELSTDVTLGDNSDTAVPTEKAVKTYVDAHNYDTVIPVNSADYVITDTDNSGTIVATTGAVDRTITLPTAADNVGRVIHIKKIDAGAGDVIIDGEGGETIDGNLTVTINAQYVCYTVQSDGTGWWIL